MNKITNRIRANSQSLQQHFPKIYHDFFAQNQWVYSASNSFLWIGEFSGFRGGLTLVQKLPFRAYVGLQKIGRKNLYLDSEYLSFVPNEQVFKYMPLDLTLQQNLLYLLKNQLPGGLKINILCELPLGHSLGSAGAIAASLAGLVFHLQGKSIESNEIAVFKKAWQISSQNKAGKSSGASPYAAIVSGFYPIVFYAKNGEYWAHSLKEVFNLPEVPIWPFDYALIYSGKRSNTESVLLSFERSMKQLKEEQLFLTKKMDSKFSEDFEWNYLSMLNLLSLKALRLFGQFFKDGAQEEKLVLFFKILNQFHNLLTLMDVSNSTIDLISRLIHQYSIKGGEREIGIKITGVGQGGDLLVTTPYGFLRHSIDQVISEVRKITRADIWLDYASWIDGHDNQGLRLEQDVSQRIFFPSLARNHYLLSSWRSGVLTETIIRQKDLHRIIPKIDLFLDQVHNRVFIRGNHLCSKELPSQKATVMILKSLLKSKNFLIKNNQIPSSSYRYSRYDLQGKITTPLAKAIKRRLSQEILLRVSGGMYDNFSLEMKPNGLLIALLEKI